MDFKKLKMTTAQFAQLHNINKRTLHYYDNIGLFSPKYKDSNKYRYYDYSQSIQFELIKMLRNLHMSINEIKEYINTSNIDDFLHIVEKKRYEIDEEIRKLKNTQKILSKKHEQILNCKKITNMQMEIIECQDEYLLTTTFKSKNKKDFSEVLDTIKENWEPEQYHMGIGCYISLKKVKEIMFNDYDGMFVPVIDKKMNSGVMLKPKGKYLCGYLKGTWSNIPKLYEKMIQYANIHDLKLTGYAYERWLNDFITFEEEYVTQIMIKIE